MVVYEEIYFEAYTNDKYYLTQKDYCTIIFYIRKSLATLEIFQLT